MNEILGALLALPPITMYLLIGAGAALENIVPPVPADTFVLAGAFLAAAGRIDATVVFLVTWIANVGSALGVYATARRFGKGFFKTKVGHRMLHPKQLERIGVFYGRWGTGAIFLSRFLPAFRSLVPVFAGVSHLGVWRTAIPITVASAFWYGVLVLAGVLAGRNFGTILSWFQGLSLGLGVIAGALILAFGIWWWRTRHPDS